MQGRKCKLPNDKIPRQPIDLEMATDQMIERGNICPASAALEPIPPLLTGTWLRNVPFTDLTTLLDLRLRNSNSFETSLFTFVNIFSQGKLNECDIVCKYLSHRAQIDDNFSARSTFFLFFVFLYIVIFSSSSHHHLRHIIIIIIMGNWMQC